LAAVFKLSGVRHGGHKCRGGECTDALLLSKPQAYRIGAVAALDSAIARVNALLELNELLIQVPEKLHGQRRQRFASTTRSASIPAWGTIPRSSMNAWSMPSEVSTKTDEDHAHTSSVLCGTHRARASERGRWAYEEGASHL
jgi:hypothetical protein